MAKVTINPPAAPPEPTISLELTLEEAWTVYTMMNAAGHDAASLRLANEGSYEILEALYVALEEAGL